MNREILFRGKRVDNGENNGEWVEGYYWQNEVGNHFIKLVVSAGEYVLIDYEVIPETVGQFTGLLDKNGKKIFEGDILDCSDRIVYVKWNVNCGCWDSEFIEYKGNLCSNGITAAEWKYRAEIIGNIHDNAELLEVEE